MTEQSLNLLKRIADQLAIAFHGAHRSRRFGKTALDQHRQHVDRKGMPEGSVANSDTVSKIGLMYCQGQLR